MRPRRTTTIRQAQERPHQPLEEHCGPPSHQLIRRDSQACVHLCLWTYPYWNNRLSGMCRFNMVSDQRHRGNNAAPDGETPGTGTQNGCSDARSPRGDDAAHVDGHALRGRRLHVPTVTETREDLMLACGPEGVSLASIHPEPWRDAVREVLPSRAAEMEGPRGGVDSRSHTYVTMHLEGSGIEPWSVPGTGPCVRAERSTDIRRCKSPIRNWDRAKAGVLRARRPRESGRTVPAGRRRPRSASAFAELQSIARGNRRM